jgi:uncharacterized membrane protein
LQHQFSQFSINIFIMNLYRKAGVNAIEIIALAFVLLTICIVAYNYSNLPARIPCHFTFPGKPDDWNGKESVWLIPVISGVIYFMLTSITIFIRFLKRPDELTTEVMVLVSGMIRQLKLLFSILFFCLAYGTIRISIGKANGLGNSFSPLFLLLMVGVIISSVIRIIRKQRVRD